MTATIGPEPPRVRELCEGDGPHAGAMLARAFATDPTTEWLCPTVRGRERRLELWYCLNVMALRDAGEGWVTHDLSA